MSTGVAWPRSHLRQAKFLKSSAEVAKTSEVALRAVTFVTLITEVTLASLVAEATLLALVSELTFVAFITSPTTALSHARHPNVKHKRNHGFVNSLLLLGRTRNDPPRVH